jgi:hypothetical protein
MGVMGIDPRRIEVIDDATAEMYRRMTPVERIKRGLAMGAFARKIIAAGVRAAHPAWSEAEVRKETARRFAGGHVEVGR